MFMCLFCSRSWEVLNGVGVDGVGVIFPFFYAFFAFLRIFRLFFAFLRFSSLFSSSPKGQGQTTAIYCKNGEFHSDPVCTDPVQNFLTEVKRALKWQDLFKARLRVDMLPRPLLRSLRVFRGKLRRTLVWKDSVGA